MGEVTELVDSLARYSSWCAAALPRVMAATRSEELGRDLAGVVEEAAQAWRLGWPESFDPGPEWSDDGGSLLVGYQEQWVLEACVLDADYSEKQFWKVAELGMWVTAAMHVGTTRWLGLPDEAFSLYLEGHVANGSKLNAVREAGSVAGMEAMRQALAWKLKRGPEMSRRLVGLVLQKKFPESYVWFVKGAMGAG